MSEAFLGCYLFQLRFGRIRQNTCARLTIKSAIVRPGSRQLREHIAGELRQGIIARTHDDNTVADLRQSASADALAMAKRLDAARVALVEVIDFVAGNTKASPNAVFSGSVPYLMLAGNVMAGWQMARSMLAAEQSLAKGQDAEFMKAKITTARFYADHILTKAPGLRDSIVEGADSVTAMALDAF
jgi:hypothetical protein